MFPSFEPNLLSTAIVTSLSLIWLLLASFDLYSYMPCITKYILRYNQPQKNGWSTLAILGSTNAVADFLWLKIISRMLFLSSNDHACIKHTPLFAFVQPNQCLHLSSSSSDGIMVNMQKRNSRFLEGTTCSAHKKQYVSSCILNPRNSENPISHECLPFTICIRDGRETVSEH